MKRVKLERLRVGLLGVAAILLAACSGGNEPSPSNNGVVRGRAAGPEIEVRSEKSRRADPEQSAAFEFLRYSVNTDADAPVACLAFSSSLRPKDDYSPYVESNTDTPLALSVSGSNLCVGGLSFGENVTLTLRKGLPGAGRDNELIADEIVVLDFGDRPTFVGFKGNGVILPRIDADGVAIETVNVSALNVSVSRVTDRSLVFKRITSGFSAGRGEYHWENDNEEPSDLAEHLWDGVLDVDNVANAPVTTVFSMASAVDQLEPGAYYINIEEVSDTPTGERRPARAARWLIITDLAMTSYEGAEGLQVSVRSIDTAKTARDVRIDLIARNNEILSSQMTDVFGRVAFDAPLTRGSGPMSPRMLLAYDDNGDFAMLDLDRPAVDLSQHPVGGRMTPGLVDAYLYTDRGIYRPGETVHVSTLMRDSGGKAVNDRAGSLIIYGPNGLEADRVRFDEAQDAGGISHSFDLSKQAARGIWRFALELDGVGYVKDTTVSVEDFVPQRVELKLETDDETPILKNETRPIQANVRFLYGAPGAGLDLEGRMRVETAYNPFADFKGYYFGKHNEQFRERELGLRDAVADGAGEAVLRIDMSQHDITSSKPLRLRAVVTAFEPGGRPVSDDVRIPYRPSDKYIGLKPQFDGSASEGAQARFNVAAVNAMGEATSAELNWKLVRIDWNYDWYRTDGGRWTWRRSRNVIDVDQGVTNVGADAAAEIITRELDWGDYELAVVDETGVEASYGFWAGWGGGPQAGAEAPDRIRISAPEEAVEIGKKASYTLLPPYAGEAEIVIANEKIIETRVVTLPENGAKLDFNVTEEWGAGAYLMVSVFTPRDPVARPRPRRAVGVAYSAVNVDDKTFIVDVEAPEIAEPRQTLEIEINTVDGPRGEKAFATVAAVDEGILLLTKFKSPNPNDWFFGKRRLGVALKDDYGRLLDPNQGAAATPRSGGDSIGGAGLSVVPTKTVALFSGPVTLGRNGKATVELDLPDFNGELRLMTVVWSENGIGASSQPLTVRDDVPAEIILPRFLAPGDTSTATATLDNVAGAAGAYQVNLSAKDGLSLEENAYSVDLSQGARSDNALTLNANATGVSGLGISVSGPGGFAASRDYGIEVRSPYLPMSRINRVTLGPAETYTASPDILAGFVAGSGELQLSLSPIPMDAAALYDSLSRYPYGCTEQTVSRAMPLLYANNLADIAGRASDTDIRTRVQEAVSTILNRQGGDGAIGLWRMGDGHASPWLGAYAVDFLARAKEKGYVVPDAALERAYEGLAHVAEQERLWDVNYDYSVYTSRWNTDTLERLKARSAAYAAYVLARAGKIDASRLRYLHDEQLNQTENPLARAHIGAALSLIGDRSRSKSAFDAAESVIGYENRGDYYQTARRDMAGILALSAESGGADRTERLTELVSNELPEPDELTTQEKAFMLLAANALTNGSTRVEADVTGQTETIIPFRLLSANQAMLDQGEITVENTGDGPIWLTSIARGAPTTAPSSVSSGLTVTKTIATTSGARPNLGALRQGDRLVVTLTVRAASRRLHPVIMADLLPAGFEIETVLNSGTGEAYPTSVDLSQPNVAEARDDRFIAAIDLRNQRTERLAYVVRAVTPGEYAIPGVVAEDMYRPDVFGRSSAGRITILPSN